MEKWSALITFIFLMLAVGGAPELALASTACQLHSPDAPDVPLCPENGSNLLSEGYPALAVSISDIDRGPRFVVDFVETVLKAQPNKPPQFLLNVNDETIEQVRRKIESLAKDPQQKALWISALTKVNGPRWDWQQDYFQPFVDPRTGRPSLREVAAYENHPEGPGRAVFTEMSKVMKEACDVDIGAPIPKPSDSRGMDGTTGGNIEGGPNGLCFIGTDHLSKDDYDRQVKEVCKNGRVVEVPTSWLKVGHADEVVMTVRTGTGDCNHAVLVASPNEAMEAMARNPRGLAFTNVDGIYGRALRDRIPNDLCRRYHRNKTESQSRPAPERSRSINRFWEWIVDRAHADDLDPLSDEEIKECSRMTNDDFLRALRADAEIANLNAYAEEQMKKLIEETEKAWRAVAPNCTPKIVKVPSLFLGRYFKSTAEGSGGVALLSNPTNAQQFGETLIMPKPGIAAFEAQLRKTFESLELKAEFVDSHMAREAGSLHCATNAIRYCRPRR